MLWRFVFHVVLYGFNLLLCLFFVALLPDLQHLFHYSPNAILFVPLAWRIPVTLLAFDFLSYVSHRLSHSVPFLWRFHQVHHNDSILDFTTSFREHFGQTLFTLFMTLLGLFLLNPPGTQFRLYLWIAFSISLFAHSNLILPRFLERALGSFLVTPGFHRHHHAHTTKSASHFGAIFTFWDSLFSTKWEFQTSLGNGRRVEEPLSLSSALFSPFSVVSLFLFFSTSAFAGSCSSPLLIDVREKKYDPTFIGLGLLLFAGVLWIISWVYRSRRR